MEMVTQVNSAINGLMMFPNLIGVVALSPVVIKITKNYIARKIKNQDVEPVLPYDDSIQAEKEYYTKDSHCKSDCIFVAGRGAAGETDAIDGNTKTR